MNKKVGILCFAGIVVIVLSVILVVSVVPKVINGQLKKNLALVNGTNSFKFWQKLPMPLTFSVYIFNVTNAEEINAGKKPKVQEIGPYVYDEYIEKIILNTSEANDTITFMRRKTYYFNKTLSGRLTEDDNVTVLNFAYIGIVTKANEQVKGIMSLLNSALPVMFKDLKDPFLRANVGEILFKGIFINCSAERPPTVELVCDGMRMKLPPTMKYIDTPKKKGIYFSMLGHTNATNEGPLVANRGSKDLSKLGLIESFKGENSMSIYKGQCGTLRGTDSTIFPPMDRSHVSNKIYIFEPNVCRSMFAELKGHKETFGLKSYRYETTMNTLASKYIVPENECFCSRNWSSVMDSCRINGVHDLSACQQVPVIVSYPHFYLASEELLGYVDGLKPAKERHETFVELERLSSAPLRGRKRLQFNMQLQATADVPILANVRSGLFPILWVEEGAEVTSDILDRLRTANSMVYILEIIQWLPLFLGVFLLIGAVFFYFKSSRGHLAMKTDSINYMVNASRDNGVKNTGFGDDSLAAAKSDSMDMKN